MCFARSFRVSQCSRCDASPAATLLGGQAAPTCTARISTRGSPGCGLIGYASPMGSARERQGMCNSVPIEEYPDRFNAAIHGRAIAFADRRRSRISIDCLRATYEFPVARGLPDPSESLPLPDESPSASTAMSCFRNKWYGTKMRSLSDFERSTACLKSDMDTTVGCGKGNKNARCISAGSISSSNACTAFRSDRLRCKVAIFSTTLVSRNFSSSRDSGP